MDADRRYLTAKECAALRRVTLSALRSERHRGDGPPYVRSGTTTVLYPADLLYAWLDARLIVPNGHRDG